MTRQPTAIIVYKIDVGNQVYWARLVPRNNGYYAGMIIGEGNKKEGYVYNTLFESIETGRNALQKFMDDNMVSLINGEVSRSKSIREHFSLLPKESIKIALTKLHSRK